MQLPPVESMDICCRGPFVFLCLECRSEREAEQLMRELMRYGELLLLNFRLPEQQSVN